MALSVHVDPQGKTGSPAPQFCRAQLRAMALWPRLDRRALSRCGCDPARIAQYVSRRTRIPAAAIEILLSRP
jgi:hypothetical protein